MPTFHTKTIESILEPVVQQVSHLVILHEQAGDAGPMPDLEKPVQAISKAVANLVKVGREIINSSDDRILRQDMPSALLRVERASRLLEEDSLMLKSDPYSQPARKKLIEGARGILQGTSALLLCFDESEVRKIVRECKKVLEYLAVAEVIETMEDLVQFVKDLSPCLSKVTKDVENREKELTHQDHRQILLRCLDSVKSLAPDLICSMKIYVQLRAQGKRSEEAAENRNYLSQRMTNEVNEMIRVLQLTTEEDELEWEADSLTYMKKAQNAIVGKLPTSHDWLEDPRAVIGGIGEKAVRLILDYAQKVADRALPPDRDAIKKAVGDIESMTNALCELRANGQGTTPQAHSLARGIEPKLKELNNLVGRAIQNLERSERAKQQQQSQASRNQQQQPLYGGKDAFDELMSEMGINMNQLPTRPPPPRQQTISPQNTVPRQTQITPQPTVQRAQIIQPSKAQISPPQVPQRPITYNVSDRRVDNGPPRPPLPVGDGPYAPPPRPPPPEIDEEYEAKFPTLQQPTQPIMVAAHSLHQEIRQWSSKENEIIAAAKKMALLMVRLNQLVSGDGSKRELIACAKAIAEASEEVTRLGKEQAKLCTDKRMRTNILQVCERIPTIGTQLRILSTVKATMLGAQVTEEDQEATDMLVGNAQNLMHSVRETVRACEAASIKIRTDSGHRMVWTRKEAWYN